LAVLTGAGDFHLQVGLAASPAFRVAQVVVEIQAVFDPVAVHLNDPVAGPQTALLDGRARLDRLDPYRLLFPTGEREPGVGLIPPVDQRVAGRGRKRIGHRRATGTRHVAVAAAVEQAADAAEADAHRDRRGNHVHDLPGRDAVLAEDEVPGG